MELQENDGVNMLYIGYDRWHVDESLLQAYENYFGRNVMIEVRQGPNTLSVPMKEFKAELDADIHVYNNNPVDKWCLSNLEIKTDINGNIQPIKGMESTQRIDGAVAQIIAKVILRDKMAEYENMI